MARKRTHVGVVAGARRAGRNQPAGQAAGNDLLRAEAARLAPPAEARADHEILLAGDERSTSRGISSGQSLPSPSRNTMISQPAATAETPAWQARP